MNQQRQQKPGSRGLLVSAESVMDAVHEPMLMLDANLRVVSVNRSFCRTFNFRPEDVEGHPIFDVAGSLFDVPRLRRLLEEDHAGKQWQFKW